MEVEGGWDVVSIGGMGKGGTVISSGGVVVVSSCACQPVNPHVVPAPAPAAKSSAMNISNSLVLESRRLLLKTCLGHHCTVRTMSRGLELGQVIWYQLSSLTMGFGQTTWHSC